MERSRKKRDKCNAAALLLAVIGAPRYASGLQKAVVDLKEQCPLPTQDLSAPAAVNLLT